MYTWQKIEFLFDWININEKSRLTIRATKKSELMQGGGPYENIEIIPKDFQILTYKCLNFLNFLTYTKICQTFSLITKKLGKFQE